jgi:hypothetical protein
MANSLQPFDYSTSNQGYDEFKFNDKIKQLFSKDVRTIFDKTMLNDKSYPKLNILYENNFNMLSLIFKGSNGREDVKININDREAKFANYTYKPKIIEEFLKNNNEELVNIYKTVVSMFLKEYSTKGGYKQIKKKNNNYNSKKGKSKLTKKKSKKSKTHKRKH